MVAQTADNAVQTFSYERTYEVDAATGVATGNYGDWTLVDSTNVPTDVIATTKVGYKVAPETETATEIQAMLNNFQAATDTEAGTNGVDFIYTSNVTDNQAPSDPGTTTDSQTLYNETHKTFTFTATGHIGDASGVEVTQTADNAIQTFNYERTYEVDATTGEVTGNYGYWTLVGSTDVPTDIIATTKTGYKAEPGTETAAAIQAMLDDFQALTDTEAGTNGVDFIYTTNVSNIPAPSDTTDAEYANTHKTYTFTATGHIDNASGEAVTQIADNAIQTFNYERTYEVDAATGKATGNYGSWTLADSSEAASTITPTAKLGYGVAPISYEANDINAALTNFASDADTTSVNDGIDFIYTTNVSNIPAPSDTTDAEYENTHKMFTFTATGHIDNASGEVVTQTAGNAIQTFYYERTYEVDATTGEATGNYGNWTLVDPSETASTITATPKLGYKVSPDTYDASGISSSLTTFANNADTSSINDGVDFIYTTNVADVTTPINTGDPIDPSDPTGPKSDTTITDAELNKTVTRQISDQYVGGPKDGESDDLQTQTATYSRTAEFDQGTGEFIGFTAWTMQTNNLTEFDAPSVENYAPTPTSVNAASDTEIATALSGDTAAVSIPTIEITYVYSGTTTTDPDGGTTVTTTDDNGNIVTIDKTWSDGDKTHVDIDTDTNVITVTETPNGDSPLAPVTINAGDVSKTGKTTVTNNEPNGVTLTHDTTGIDTDGNQTSPSNTGESISSDGTISYFKSATSDAVSVDPSDYYVTTTTQDPNGGTTDTTVDGNGKVTVVNKTWPDGDTTHVEINNETNVITVVETPNGEDPLAPVTISPNDTVKTGKTTVTDNEPDGVVLTHDTTGTDTDGNPTGPSSTGESITSDGTVSYFKSATGDAVSVSPDDYYLTTTTDDPNGGTTTTTVNGNDEVTEINKIWPDGDTTHAEIDTNTNVITVTETPVGEDPLTPVTINPNDTNTTGKTTITNNEPDGVTLTHDTTGTDTDGNPTSPATSGETVTSGGTISYFKSANGDAVSVDPADYYTTTTTTDPNGGTTVTTINGNGEVTKIDKTWADGDKTHVDIDTGTNVITVTETPNGQDPLDPVTVNPGDTTQIGKTTVTNTEPNGVTLIHDTTGTDTDGNPASPSASGETVTSDGTISYFKSATGDAVSVDPADNYVTTTTNDPNGGTTTTTVNGNGEVTKIDKTWPDGDKTHVEIDTNTNVVTVTETPNGEDPLAPVTIKPNDTATTGKTTVANNEPDGVTLTHDTTGTDTDGNPTSSSNSGEIVTSDGTISYFKSANGDAVNVDPDDYYATTTTDDPNGGTTSTTVNGNGEVTEIDKTWPDGDKTRVDIDTNTNVITVTETPNGDDPLTPVMIKPGDTTQTGKTTVTNNEPDGVTLTHNTTGTDTNGNPTSSSSVGEGVTSNGTISYFKAGNGKAVSVDPTDYYTTTTTDDPNGGTTTTTIDGNGEVTKINKTWPDGDTTNVTINNETNVITVVETPNGEDPLAPVIINPNNIATTGKTTVTNNEPNGVTLTHDTTGTDTDGNPTSSSSTGENVTSDGTISYFKSANGDSVSVDPADSYVTTTIDDPNGGTTSTTVNGNGEVTKIDKIWPDGDKTRVDIDTNTNVVTVTETPSGQDPLAPVTINPGEETTTGKTTITNNEPNGITLTHDGTGVSTVGETITSAGTVSYFKTANGDPVSVEPTNYYTSTTTDDPNGGSTTTTLNGNGEVTTIDKTWPNGDKTHVEIDDSGTAVVTETPSGKAPLDPITVAPGETGKTDETTISNNEPDRISLSHDDTGTSTIGETIAADGTISYFKSANGEAVSVEPGDYYVRDNGDGQQTKPSTSTGTATATTTTSGSNDVQASGAQTDANGNKVTDTTGRIETNESATNANKSGKANGKLPQTSDAQNEVRSLGLIGLAISLIGLAGTRKKRRKEDQ